MRPGGGLRRGAARRRRPPRRPWPVSESPSPLGPRVLRGGHRAEPGRRVGCRVAPVSVARLGGDHARHDAPGPHAARVDVEVVEVVARVGLDAALLRLQHHLVLEEDARHALAQPRGDHLLVQAPVAGEGPQVEAGVVGLGRHRVDHRAGDALAAVALRARRCPPWPRRRRSRPSTARCSWMICQRSTRPVVVGEPVLQVALPERRRVDAEHPLGDRDRACRRG